MITARYRTDYTGEFIITQSTWSGGKKRQKREWVANPIENQHISGRAVCIGSDVDALRFDYKILQRHRGGLLGSKKITKLRPWLNSQTNAAGLYSRN